MVSTKAFDRIEAAFDELDAAQRHWSELSFDALTVPELREYLDRFDALRGKLAALKYDLTSPFARPSTAWRTNRATGNRNK